MRTIYFVLLFIDKDFGQNVCVAFPFAELLSKILCSFGQLLLFMQDVLFERIGPNPAGQKWVKPGISCNGLPRTNLNSRGLSLPPFAGRENRGSYYWLLSCTFTLRPPC